MQPQSVSHAGPVSIGQLIATQFMNHATQPLYDFSGLGKLAGNAEFVREMQQMFIEQVPAQLSCLAATIEAEDWPNIALRAHSLKATFGNLRIEPSTSLLKELEILAGQHHDKHELLDLLQVVEQSGTTVIRHFRQELGQAD